MKTRFKVHYDIDMLQVVLIMIVKVVARGVLTEASNPRVEFLRFYREDFIFLLAHFLATMDSAFETQIFQS